MNFESIIGAVIVTGIGIFYWKYKRAKQLAKEKAYLTEKLKIELHLGDLKERGTISNEEFRKLHKAFMDRLDRTSPKLKSKLRGRGSDRATRSTKSK